MAGIPDFLALNTSLPPFDNPEVRQAVALAIDRADIRDVAYFGAGEVGLDRGADGSPWYDETGVYAAEPDVDKAKAAARRGRLSRRADRQVPRPAAVSRAAQDRPGRARAAQGDRHRHDRSSRSTCRSGSTASSSGDYQITCAYQERTIDPDNFYSLVVKTGGPVNTMRLLQPRARRPDRQGRGERRRGRAQGTLQPDPHAS